MGFGISNGLVLTLPFASVSLDETDNLASVTYLEIKGSTSA